MDRSAQDSRTVHTKVDKHTKVDERTGDYRLLDYHNFFASKSVNVIITSSETEQDNHRTVHAELKSLTLKES